ncbi:MAG: cupredoxin domain-containing protein [Candidatus Acidiferrales bacterium]
MCFALGCLAYTGGSARATLAAPAEKQLKYEVNIDNFSFGPMDLTVPAGSTVTWVNHDDVPHTVVSTEKKFGSKALDTGEKFSFEFKTAGTYEYFCSLHPRMTAKVVVQ